MHTTLPELLNHPIVDRVKILLRVITMGYARLIGDYYEQITSRLKLPTGFDCTVEELKVLYAVQVSDVLIYDTVPVQEQCGTHNFRISTLW